jgi:hypothetical protein
VRYITTVIKMVLKVGWHREHFLSPLLQLHAAKGGFEVSIPVFRSLGGMIAVTKPRLRLKLVECPGGTGDMQAKLKAGEIDVCIG